MHLAKGIPKPAKIDRIKVWTPQVSQDMSPWTTQPPDSHPWVGKDETPSW